MVCKGVQSDEYAPRGMRQTVEGAGRAVPPGHGGQPGGGRHYNPEGHPAVTHPTDYGACSREDCMTNEEFGQVYEERRPRLLTTLRWPYGLSPRMPKTRCRT